LSGDQLWKELNWCVEQLELGLKMQKATPGQAAEALRAIKTLRSDKAPLVKKRQLMRAMFGDYRKKMEEERCRELKLTEAAVRSARIMEVKREVRSKSCQFIRKRSGANIGRKLEHTQEELENYLDRLTHVLFDADTRKRGDHHEQKSYHHHHRRADVPSEPSAEEAARSQHLSSYTRVQ
ncbi:PREDICTED: UPF0488 protein C8orf33 homolog, partial [Apaloderma vittatum]|uniref:UPF0488 protein C8orf33 homolog n=1 Tax=Apaloderma vittatum TaxID=57397 RepID=UPI0005212BB3